LNDHIVYEQIMQSKLSPYRWLWSSNCWTLCAGCKVCRGSKDAQERPLHHWPSWYPGPQSNRPDFTGYRAALQARGGQ